MSFKDVKCVSSDTSIVYVKYHDLKCDIYVEVYFDHPNDMIEFFSKYNPCTIDICAIDGLLRDKDV